VADFASTCTYVGLKNCLVLVFVFVLPFFLKKDVIRIALKKVFRKLKRFSKKQYPIFYYFGCFSKGVLFLIICVVIFFLFTSKTKAIQKKQYPIFFIILGCFLKEVLFLIICVVIFFIFFNFLFFYILRKPKRFRKKQYPQFFYYFGLLFERSFVLIICVVIF